MHLVRSLSPLLPSFLLAIQKENKKMKTNHPTCGGLTEGLLLLVLCFFMSPFTISSSTTNLTDMSTLLSLKSQFLLESDNPLVQNWTAKSSFCNWIGVSCSPRHHRVISLNLSYMDLQGTISPHIGNLSFLIFLRIQNNSFHGPLQDTIGKLWRLRVIDVSFNQLEGNIPSTLSWCQRLESIYLAWNRFQGNIPKEIGNLPSLEMLQLESNFLTGGIPSTIFNITTLRGLDLAFNNISGDIPTDICFSLPKLQFLYLANNLFGGYLPTSLCQCKDLQEIYLAENNLKGSIPRDVGCLSKLQYFSLSRNKFTGTLPPSLGNLSSLLHLILDENNLWGEIPESLTRLFAAKFLYFGDNTLSGRIPGNMFNLSSVVVLAFSENNLTGNIPEFSYRKPPQLEELYLAKNQLRGRIPNSISNASQLTVVVMSYNSFDGPVPSTLGNLRLLTKLYLQKNQLSSGPSQRELHFLTSLTECRQLKYLDIGYNPLNGELPDSIGNLSSSLETFLADASQIKGRLPPTVGNLSNLMTLQFSWNNLTGTIPSLIENLRQLQRLSVAGNNIQGRIPSDLCRLTSLGALYLLENRLSGSIPNCIGNLSRMQVISFGDNALESIPLSLWNLSSIISLNLSFNLLTGYLPPDIGNMMQLVALDLSKNQLSGNLPVLISKLKMLTYLDFSNNSFQGNIPKVVGDLASLELLVLSSNNFSGRIPISLEKLPYLRYIDLSYNKLSGEVPTSGVFKNITIESLAGNDELCIDLLTCQITRNDELCRGLPTCRISDHSKQKKLSFWLKYVFLPVASVMMLSIFLVVILYRKRRSKQKAMASSSNEFPTTMQLKFISYYELGQATNNFSEANLLGVGSFGSVYRGTLSDGEQVAVKVINLQIEGGSKSFDIECEILRNVRHRNLLKVISSCSNLDYKALILPYMSNGSLEKFLYSLESNFLQRLNIMIDIATGVEYLHHGYAEPVVHCDLKPSNVLLDEDMVAYVSDFGIAKILAKYNSLTPTSNLGTTGYIAPEYGLEGRVSTKGDVYSYGIMLMETFTRKKPTDPMFSNELSLREWVSSCFPDQVMELAVDANFDGDTLESLQCCLSSIMELGLMCSRHSALERLDMKNVVAALTKIKQQYLISIGE